MGTAGITHFHQDGIDTDVICHVYKQSDGYPDSLGEQIKNVFADAKLVNGIRFDIDNQVNGMGCAAATFIAYTKNGTGGVYMIANAPDWADYDYHIFHNGMPESPRDPPAQLHMKIMSGRDEIWCGAISDFDSATLFDDEA